MAEKLFLRALKSEKTSILVIHKKDLKSVPALVGKLYFLKILDLKSNQISKLCPEFANLTELTKLNLGNNNLEEVPEELMYLKKLEILHLYGNLIKSFSPKSFDGLEKLNILNMNNNKLTNIPPEIKRLKKLKYLSLNYNQLTGIPKELCSLAYLSEIQLNFNQIVSIPEEIKTMKSLKKLSLARNRIEVFPEMLCSMKKLKILDIAGNFIQMLPQEVQEMELKKMFCEENPFLQRWPIFVAQREEVFTLKEIVGRFILNEMNEDPLYVKAVENNPEVMAILANKKECLLCGKGILVPGIECVLFIHPKKNWRISSKIKKVPVQTILCSISCFKERDPSLYRLKRL